jgi:hypothetical protein
MPKHGARCAHDVVIEAVGTEVIHAARVWLTKNDHLVGCDTPVEMARVLQGLIRSLHLELGEQEDSAPPATQGKAYLDWVRDTSAGYMSLAALQAVFAVLIQAMASTMEPEDIEKAVLH